MLMREELCSLIPHDGDMCLLDRLIAWDAKTVCCEADSHRNANNPLRKGGQLSSIHVIEYGAQAIAVHGGLLARQQGGKLARGYLVSLRDIKLEMLDLSTLQHSLTVEAEQLIQQADNLIYIFSVSVEGHSIATGRATVVGI